MTDEDIRNQKLSQIPQNLKINHVYCQVCGSTMVASRIQKNGLFDMKTGIQSAPSIVYVWQCPNSGHDYIEIP